MLYYFSETKFNFCVLKVGDLVNKREIAKQVVLQMDGIAKTASFLKAGLSKTDVCTLCNQGYLERIRHGYYSLAESEMMPEEQLLITLIPEGIVSLDSALFYHGYSDFAPRQWTIAVPRTISRSKLTMHTMSCTYWGKLKRSLKMLQYLFIIKNEHAEIVLSIAQKSIASFSIKQFTPMQRTHIRI